jgi:hypothetical protein
MSDRDNIVQISPTITTIIKNKTPKIRVKTRMRKGIERYCSIVGFLNEVGRSLKKE